MHWGLLVEFSCDSHDVKAVSSRLGFDFISFLFFILLYFSFYFHFLLFLI